MGLTRFVTQLANEMFTAPIPAATAPGVADANALPTPPSAPSPPAGAMLAPAGVTLPSTPESAPSTPAITELPSTAATPTVTAIPSGESTTPLSANAPGATSSDLGGRSPFDAPLDFGAIAAPFDPFAGNIGTDALSLSLLDARTPSPDVPAFGLEPAAPAPPVALTVDTFEIVPTNPSGRTPASLGGVHVGRRSPGEGRDGVNDAPIRELGPALFDANALKREFPILNEPVRGKRLVWLDNAATTQKPKAVIDRLQYFYEHENSNIHRAAHTLAARATDAYESARESVRRFIKASSTREIVFVRGTSEGINLIAQSWGRRNVRPGDEIVISWLEHHANIVPWQQLCEDRGARLRVAPVDSRGQVILEQYEKLLGPKTKLVSFTQVSNALGTITPAKEMIEMAHRHGALVLLDGAQAVSHMPVDVQALGCDFFVFSGHKVFGPTGIGAVFGRSDLLDTMPPWQGGGNMIQDVTFERTLYQPAPARFEAGTGNIADAVGLGAALDWLARVGVERVERYEHDLLEYGTEKLKTVPGLTMIGTAPAKAGVLSFVLEGQKTEEVGGTLDQEGIAVRSGHHCAQPILRRFGLEATVRASLAPYNTCEDIDALAAALHRIQAGRGGTR
jgi:cysteine desulfurase/selenocysteine lyase